MTRFVSISCYKCKEVFGMAEDSHAHLRRSSQSFWCPNGHSQHFPLGPTDAEKLQAQLDTERRRAHRAEQRVAEKADEAQTAWRTASAYKGQATRLRNRAKAGVCPCCNRTFKQLAAHMATQHPQFTPIEEETVDAHQ